MGTYVVTLVDRQTGKTSTVRIEAKSYSEAKKIAMEKPRHSYQVK